MIKEIQLTRGQTAIIDAADYPLVKGYKWTAQKNPQGKYYAYRGTKIGGRKGKYVAYKLHRIIAGAKKGDIVDHVNGNTLDNRRCNLRICTKQENNRNTGRKKNNKSGFKGVHQKGNSWIMQIQIDGKRICKSYKTAMEAASAYDEHAKEHHGAFAYTNQCAKETTNNREQ